MRFAVRATRLGSRHLSAGGAGAPRKDGREVAMRVARIPTNDAARSMPRGVPEFLRTDMTCSTAHRGMNDPVARGDRKYDARQREQGDLDEGLARVGA